MKTIYSFIIFMTTFVSLFSFARIAMPPDDNTYESYTETSITTSGQYITNELINISKSTINYVSFILGCIILIYLLRGIFQITTTNKEKHKKGWRKIKDALIFLVILCLLRFCISIIFFMLNRYRF